MQKFTLSVRALTLAAAAAAILAAGDAAQARNGAPFCSENYNRGGLGRVCAYYSFEQCLEATSGVGGSCNANAWYQPREYYEPAPRRYRKYRYQY